MTYEFNLIYAGWTLFGIVVGLALGNLTWGRAARRHKRAADSVANAAAAASARTQAEHSTRELAAAQAAMRPLADEVDRLKRELAKAKRPVQVALPLAGAAVAGPPADSAVVPPLDGAAVYPPLGAPAVSPALGTPAEAMAGTGPIVVGAPDIRQLKGVGGRFAAALDGLGLGTVDAIARLTADEALDADARLGSFTGRIARDRLVEQATLLDEGRTTEYEARFGKLG